MATKKQIQANRANARHSTGPRSAEGKSKASLNALKHGLRSQTTVLPGENIEDFHILVDELEDQFQPATALEWTLLRQLADAEWRMRRVPRLEAGGLASKLYDMRRHYEKHPSQLPGDPALAETVLIGAMTSGDAADADVLSKLSRYEARLSHRYFKALEHLLQARDRRRSPSPPPGSGGEDPEKPKVTKRTQFPETSGLAGADITGPKSGDEEKSWGQKKMEIDATRSPRLSRLRTPRREKLKQRRRGRVRCGRQARAHPSGSKQPPPERQCM